MSIHRDTKDNKNAPGAGQWGEESLVNEWAEFLSEMKTWKIILPMVA